MLGGDGSAGIRAVPPHRRIRQCIRLPDGRSGDGLYGAGRPLDEYRQADSPVALAGDVTTCHHHRICVQWGIHGSWNARLEVISEFNLMSKHRHTPVIPRNLQPLAIALLITAG